MSARRVPPPTVKPVTAAIRHNRPIRHAPAEPPPGDVTDVTDVTASLGRRSAAQQSATHRGPQSAMTQPVALPLILTVIEAAGTLRIGRSSVYELMASGQLRSLKIGSRRLIARDDLDAFIEARRAGGGR